MTAVQTNSSKILPMATLTSQKSPVPVQSTAPIDPQTQKLKAFGHDALTFGSMCAASAGAMDLLTTTISTGTFKLSAPSNLLLGASFGVGAVLVKTDFGDQKLNHAKNIAAGALVGGSAVGFMSIVVRNIMAGEGTAMLGASPIAFAIGAVVGMGIAALPPTQMPHLIQR